MGSLSSTIGIERAKKMALTSEELATLIIFQRINKTWAREVHRFESKKKGRKNFDIFRDSNNRKLTSLADLKAEGVEVDESSFIPPSSNEIVSNRVGANKKARREVRAWTDQLFGKEAEQVSAESKDAAAEEDLANEAAAEVVSDDDAPERLAGETTLVVASEAIAEKLQEVADVLEDVVAAVEQSAVDLQELHSAGEPAVPEEVSASVSVAPEMAAPGAFVEEVAEAETVEEVAVEEVAVEESVAEEVALQEVADEDPTVEGEAVKEMTLQEVSAAEAGDEEVAVEEPSVREVVVQDGDEEVVVEKGDAKENIFEEVAVEEVAVEGVAAEEVASKED